MKDNHNHVTNDDTVTNNGNIQQNHNNNNDANPVINHNFINTAKPNMRQDPIDINATADNVSNMKYYENDTDETIRNRNEE